MGLEDAFGRAGRKPGPDRSVSLGDVRVQRCREGRWPEANQMLTLKISWLVRLKQAGQVERNIESIDGQRDYRSIIFSRGHVQRCGQATKWAQPMHRAIGQAQIASPGPPTNGDSVDLTIERSGVSIDQRDAVDHCQRLVAPEPRRATAGKDCAQNH